MNKQISALTAALVLGTTTLAMAQTAAPMAAPMMSPVTVKLGAQNGSGETGTATLTQAGDDVMVSVVMTGSTVPQPIHIHDGTCAKLDPKPAFPLTTVMDGKSVTTLKGMKLASLESGAYAINVHKSTTDIPAYVSCGDIPKMAAKPAM